MIRAGRFGRILAMALALGAVSSAHAAEGEAWSVSKSSGEVWMTTTGAQQVSLGQEEVLKPGDTIRTGRNGRVLLVRGAETILVAPNSVIGLPTEKKDGLSTTIVQQAGSILLEVEKRNVRHFEVETPYLAAVVKGTQFRVSVNAGSARIEVIRGQVEVADFRSGQIAQVMPGQVATAFAQGKPGLSLSGSGCRRLPGLRCVETFFCLSRIKAGLTCLLRLCWDGRHDRRNYQHQPRESELGGNAMPARSRSEYRSSVVARMT